MKISIIIGNALRGLMLVSLAWLGTGCLKSDLSDCPADSFSFTVKAVDSAGDEINEQVSDVLLYIFNDESKFIRTIETTIGSTVVVNEAIGSKITVVAWGNAKGADNVLPAETTGADISDFSMSAVKNSTRAAESYHPAADLFLGSATERVSNNSVVIPILMRRAIGGVSVEIIKVKGHTGFSDDDFSVTVRGVRCALDFNGNPIGDKHYVRPTGAFDASDLYKTGAFNLSPQPDGIVVEIYHGTDLIHSADKDSNGNPLVVKAEKLLNIEINFGTTIVVNTTLESWIPNDINKG